ncbi:general stress protein [Streptomyces sp. ADMS]|uniref:general stress protein n=1 Tax=Streptomyces sp. ADMS TaxID=3071415 RepID=UPI00296F0789|nr:general stress protein [Streptomyces sp. ADMS]MDW4906513.1 general stress protein [Streptomyces sp. ADMS]
MQAAVDRLSDEGFPVEYLDIIGSDLRLVEHVTGRLTKGRAATAGVAGGAWFGLLIGLLVALFTTGPVRLGLILGGVALGALWGAVLGWAGHAATGAGGTPPPGRWPRHATTSSRAAVTPSKGGTSAAREDGRHPIGSAQLPRGRSLRRLWRPRRGTPGLDDPFVCPAEREADARIDRPSACQEFTGSP